MTRRLFGAMFALSLIVALAIPAQASAATPFVKFASLPASYPGGYATPRFRPRPQLRARSSSTTSPGRRSRRACIPRLRPRTAASAGRGRLARARREAAGRSWSDARRVGHRGARPRTWWFSSQRPARAVETRAPVRAGQRSARMLPGGLAYRLPPGSPGIARGRRSRAVVRRVDVVNRLRIAGGVQDGCRPAVKQDGVRRRWRHLPVTC